MSDATATASDQVVIDQVDLQRFSRFDDWVNYASSVLTDEDFGYPEQRAICFDSKGRHCWIGKDFMRARDEGSFPVFWIWPSQIGADRLSLLARAEKAEAERDENDQMLGAALRREDEANVERERLEAQRDALATANKQVSNMLRGGAMAQRDAGQHHTSTMFLAWAALLDEAAVAPESPAGRQLDQDGA